MKRTMLFGAVALLFVLSAAPAGTIVSWGTNTDGLQDNVPEGNDFMAVAAGTKHSLALRADGTVAAWGSNQYGQCTAPEVDDVVAIAAGYEFSMALRETGEILTWGRNNYNQVSGKPAGSGFVAIAAGGYHGLARRANGSVAAWGWNVTNQTNVPAGTDYLDAAGGAFHSAAVRGAGPTGSIATWGTTSWGLGAAPAGDDFTAVTAGYSHSVALRSNGTLAAWGLQDGTANDDGQVTDTPLEAGYAAVEAGDHFNVALKADRSLAAWGQGTSGQTNVPAGNNYMAIAAGQAHALAISEPGMLQVLTPNGGERLQARTVQTIMWLSVGPVVEVVIEYSTDDGASWAAVSPANVGNTGIYDWLAPAADSQACLVRVTSATSSHVTDTSDAAFAIYPCPLAADLTGDCVVDVADLAVLASEWMMDGN